MLITPVSVFFARLQYLYFQVEFTHRHTWKLLHFKKSSQIQCGSASIFDFTPPTRAWGALLAPAQFHNHSLDDPHTWQAPAQNSALLEESTRIGLTHQSGEESAPKMVLCSRAHIEPFSMWDDKRADSPSSCITYHETIPVPTNLQTTYGIHHQNPACSRQAPPESGNAGGVGLSRCHQLVETAFSQDTLNRY